MSKQRNFADLEFHGQKLTERQKFLNEMKQDVPGERLMAVIEPHYPKARKNTRTDKCRIFGISQWFHFTPSKYLIIIRNMIIGVLRDQFSSRCRGLLGVFVNELKRSCGLETKAVNNAIAGVNAAVAGLLVAALDDPIFTFAIQSAADMAAGIVAFALLSVWRLSATVAGCVVASMLYSLA